MAEAGLLVPRWLLEYGSLCAESSPAGSGPGAPNADDRLRVEEMVQVGLGCFKMVETADLAWRRRVSRGNELARPEDDARIRDMYARWLAATELALARAALCGPNRELTGSEELSTASERVRALLAAWTVPRPTSTAPRPRRVRIVGRLETFLAETRAFSVALETGDVVHGVYLSEDSDEVESLRSQRVLVLGTAVFDPSGGLRQVDADEISASNADGAFFSSIPTSIPSPAPSSHFDSSQKNGLGAAVGRWPGDETDVEIRQALEELS